MKLSIKTIKGELFTVEIEPSATILDLKKKIEEVKGIEISSQKLILKGTNTSDEKTLSDYQVKEGDFLVVMQTKKLPAQAQPKNELPQVQPQVQPIGQQQPKPVQPQSQSQSQPQPQSEQPAGFEQASASNVVMGEKFDKTVDEICNMGFAKEDVKKALKAAFNNPDRAIEYLINGIPNMPEERQNPVPAQPGLGLGQGQTHSPVQSHSQPAGAQGFGSQGGAEDFGALLNNPQFLGLRNIIRQNPQLLQPLLAQIQQSQPELYNAITTNQEAFTRWLMEGGEGGAGAGAGAGGQHVIHVTPEEKEAIDRLVGLGFERQVVIQAYLVCDKDESLAANYLFDNANQAEVDEYENLQAQNRPPQGQPQGGQAQPQAQAQPLQPQTQAQVQPQPQPQPQAQPQGGQQNPAQPPQENPLQPNPPQDQKDQNKNKDQQPPSNQPQGDQQNQKKDKDGDDDTFFHKDLEF